MGPVITFINEIVYACFNKRKSPFFKHLAWIWLLIGSFLGFLFLIFLFPLSIAVYNACQLSHKFTTNENTFNGFPNRFAPTVSHRITPCFFGDGDILKGLLLRENVDKYKAISDNVDVYVGAYSTGQDQKFTGIVNRLQANSSSLDPYIQGFNADIDSAATNNDNANVSIFDMTLYTDYSKQNSKQVSEGNCFLSRDEWVFNLTQCKYNFTWSTFYGPNQFLSDQSCISIDQFNENQAKSRYQVHGVNCQSQFNETIINYFKALSAYDSGRRSNFSYIKNKIDNANALTQEAQSKGYLLLPHVARIKSDAPDLYLKLLQPGSGINHQFNCTVLRGSFNELPDDICIGTFLPLHQACIFLLIACLLAIWAAWLAYAKAMDDCQKKDNFADYEMAHSTIV